MKKFLTMLAIVVAPASVLGQCQQPAAFAFQAQPSYEVATLCQQALAQLQVQETTTTTTRTYLQPTTQLSQITYAAPPPQQIDFGAFMNYAAPAYPAFFRSTPSYGYGFNRFAFGGYGASNFRFRTGFNGYAAAFPGGGTNVIINNNNGRRGFFGRSNQQIAISGGGGGNVIINNNAGRRGFGGGFLAPGSGFRQILGLAATGAGAFGGASVGGPVGAIFGGIAGNAVGQAISGR